MEELKRVAAYIRVSTEEQKKHGYSIETQRANITEYLSKQSDMALVDFYIDEGISANKLNKRLALQRLLKDIEEDKIDMIVFTKLDRWFRSVQKYYQIQDVLDRHNVVWKTIHEDYETLTSSGKFKVNIMLSVAQNERDKTSERITDVFNYRVKEGYVVTGSQPFGFTIKDKKVVIDEDKKEIVYDIISYYEKTNSIGKTLRYIQNQYGINFYSSSLSNLLKNPKLYGSFRDNDNYCEAYITKERFDNIQAMLQKNIRLKNNDYYYIFSGLLVCDHCDHRLIGTHCGKYSYYRCNHHYNQKRCDNSIRSKELVIEQHLLDNIEKYLTEHIISVEQMEENSKPAKSNRKAIEKKLENLTELYINNFIKMDIYKQKYDSLKSQIIDEPEETKIDLTVHKNFLKQNDLPIYSSLSVEQKQAMWRSIIKEIRVRGNKVIKVIPV